MKRTVTAIIRDDYHDDKEEEEEQSRVPFFTPKNFDALLQKAKVSVCLVCHSKLSDYYTFFPCRHSCVCIKCGTSLYACPRCKKVIVSKRPYHSRSLWNTE